MHKSEIVTDVYENSIIIADIGEETSFGWLHSDSAVNVGDWQ